MQVAQAEAALRVGAGLAPRRGRARRGRRRARSGAIAVAQRAALRLAATDATTRAAKAVDLMYEAGGGTSIYATSPLQRCFRDVHVATQHAMVAPSTYELTGRLLLGLDTDSAML